MDDSTKFIPLFRPGTRIYLNRFGSDRGGTIALYGKLKSSSKIVAISHGHVIQKGQLAYTDHNTEREELGRAIHPPSDVFQAHPGELSLVEVSNEEVRLFLNEAREQHKKVVIYSGETAALYKKKVAKFGSGTQRTVGFIVEANLETGLLGDSCDGILIEEQNKGVFAKRGDSGALAYIPGRNHITGISLIFADYGQLPDHGNTVITAKLHDCKRNYQINNDEVIEIESDYGLSLMGNTQSSNQ
ncbi:hypothetical protein FSP39_005747 [Pinctada imbricata]|uniref:Uncharacterized protein n=1 Tax=Pinctada imbricata TaxID=66713 RepID=A0AA88XES3_PINIB|nr:hypothetical protein FSP39_005747 [Pinctada imbricata]